MESVLTCFLIILVCQQTQFCIGNKLYVTPTATDECKLVEEENVKCKPLHYYVQNMTKFFSTNSTFIFLPGIHHLESNDAIKVDSVTNLTLQGYHNSTEQLEEEAEIDATIQCTGTGKTGFYFRFSNYIHLERVAILHCGFLLPPDHDQKGQPRVQAALVFEYVSHLTILQTQVNSSHGFGLYGNYVIDNATISKSVFSHNKGSETHSGGNVRFFYRSCTNSSIHQLSISKCWFIHGYDVKKKANYPYATGLGLLINCPNVSVHMDNITTLNNTGEDGGNVAVRLYYISTSNDMGQVVLNNSFIMKGIGHRGGGLRVWSMFLPAQINGHFAPPTSKTVLQVLNTHFDSNYANTAGGALYISHYERDHAHTVTHKLLFSNCTFTVNQISASGNGAATEIIKHKISSHGSYFTPQFDVSFRSCNFRNNWIILDEIETAHGATIDVFSISKIYFHDCNFTNNNSTALSAVGSNIILSGKLNFENNTGVNGGAIKFCDTSVMYITNNTHILFQNNNATFFGGGIYAQQRCLETATPCFFQPDVHDYTDIKQLNMSLTFLNNTARKSGNAVYGGSIDTCYTFQHFKNSSTPEPSYYLATAIFNHIFQLQDRQSKTEISSDPIGVCLCNSDGNCNSKLNETNISDVYPGKQFSVYAVPVGQRYGRVAAVIRGRLNDMKEGSLIPIEKNISESNKCQELTFLIHTNESSVSFYLEVLTTTFLDESSYYKFRPPKVTVHLQPCPWGRVMSFSSGSGVCMCDQLLKKSQCSANSQTINRYGALWLGNAGLLTGKNNSALLVSRSCPYEYCNLNATLVTMDTLENQCNFHRTGVLCGACAEGLSVILGGPECRHCTNAKLWLILVFALMGIILVLVLIFLNLTVTEGMINGVIFYANIIQINRGVYFPYQDVSKFVSVRVLLTLISWINLDFGIRTCFYRHMDTFAKAVLQYVFPVYIWLVVLVIILLSKRYTFAQRLIGRNSVKILATLFLLSIAKLGRAVIMSLANAIITSSDENHYNVWLADGNIYYAKGKHAFLLALGVFFFLLIVIFACLVTGIQCIQRAPNVTPFKFIIRLKPLLDSYTGPYKTGSRFWTGFLLFVRIVVYVLLSLNDLNKKMLKLSMITVTCLFVLFLQSMFHGVYIRKELDALEASYTLNLGVLSAVSLLVSARNRITTSSVFVSIAILEFGCVLAYKCYILTRRCLCIKMCFWKLSRTSERNSLQNASYRNITARGQYSTFSATTQSELAITPDEFDTLGPHHRFLQIPPLANYSSPREPLLDTSTHSHNGNFHDH